MLEASEKNVVTKRVVKVRRSAFEDCRSSKVLRWYVERSRCRVDTDVGVKSRRHRRTVDSSYKVVVIFVAGVLQRVLDIGRRQGRTGRRVLVADAGKQEERGKEER